LQWLKVEASSIDPKREILMTKPFNDKVDNLIRDNWL